MSLYDSLCSLVFVGVFAVANFDQGKKFICAILPALPSSAQKIFCENYRLACSICNMYLLFETVCKERTYRTRYLNIQATQFVQLKALATLLEADLVIISSELLCS